MTIGVCLVHMEEDNFATLIVKLPDKHMVEVIAIGVGDTGRRVMTSATTEKLGNVIGWVSCVSPLGGARLQRMMGPIVRAAERPTSKAIPESKRQRSAY